MTAHATAPPERGEAPAGDTAQGFRAQTKNNIAIIALDEAEHKALARLKATAALNGMAVYDLADGSLLVTRWGLSRPVPDAHALAQFLAQMGVAT